VLLDDSDSGLHGDVSVLGDVPVGVEGSVDLVDVDGLGSGSGFLDNLGGSGHDTSSLRNGLVSALGSGNAMRSFRSLIGTAGIVHGLTTTGSFALVVVLVENSILSFGASLDLGGSFDDGDRLLAFGNTAQVLGTSVDDGSSAVGTQRLSDAPSHAAGFTRNGLGHKLCADFKSALVLGAAIGVLSLGIGSFAGLRWRDSDSTTDSLARLRVLFADQFHPLNYCSTRAQSHRALNLDMFDN